MNFNIERVHRSLNDRHYVSNNNCAVVLVSVMKHNECLQKLFKTTAVAAAVFFEAIKNCNLFFEHENIRNVFVYAAEKQAAALFP